MASGADATLNYQFSGHRRGFHQGTSYKKRPIKKPENRLISDIRTPKVAPTANKNSSPLTSPTHAGAYFVKPKLAPTPQVAVKAEKTKKWGRGRSKLQLALLALALCMIAAGGYLSFSSLNANNVAKAQAAKLTQEANQNQPSKADVPSTVKPSSSAVANYQVAPNLPRYLIIPKLGVDARVLSVGINSSGALGTPNNVYDTAWYNESAEPGQPGAVLIDGHVSSWTTQGVFYGIKTLVGGDIIEIQRGDGKVYTYKVVRSQTYPSGSVNMSQAMTPVVGGQPGLNLITCAGDVIPGTSEFNQRIVVFAEQVSVS